MTIKLEADTLAPHEVLESISLGDALESIRENLGISKVEMAEKIGISKSNYGNVVNGIDSISIKRAGDWARALGHSEKLFVQLAIQDMLNRNDYRWNVMMS